MARRKRLSLGVEGLEGRSLLSTVVSSVKTDQAVYLPGKPVHLTFTETNMGNAPVSVVVGDHDFEVTQSGNAVWKSAGAGSNLKTIQLDPGQSVTETDTWKQVTTSGYSTRGGPFDITNLIDPNDSTTSIFIPISDSTPPNTGPTGSGPSGGSSSSQGSGATGDTSTGDTSTTTGPASQQGPVTPPVDSTTTSVSTDKPAYKAGRRVHITLTIEGPGAAQAAPARELITITRGSRVVWKAARRVRALQSSEAIKMTTVWNGRPNQPGIHGLRHGTYTIEVVYGDFGGSTSIQIGGRGRSH